MQPTETRLASRSLVLTLLTGVVYPLVVTGIAQAALSRARRTAA